MRKGSSGSSRRASSGAFTSAAVALPLFLVRGAHAESGESSSQAAKSACVQAYEGSQVLRQHGHWLEAREALRVCVREECPVLVRTDCASWLGDLEEALPSVVIRATTDGVECSDVTVIVDGKVVKTGLDGRAISIDPGPHALRYETPGFPPLDATLLVREGEHFRAVAATFQSPPPVRPVPLAAWILTGVSIVAAGSFVGWAVSAKERQDALQNQCAPFCAASDVDGVRHQYMAADISLAAAAASLGLASFFYFTRPRVPIKVGVSGEPSGFTLRVSGDL